MKRTILSLLLLALFGSSTMLMAEDIVPVDTIRMMYPEVTPEPDPNENTYVFTFKGGDETGTPWRVQIQYVSETMYGTFTDADFYNLDGSIGEGYYNYIRNNEGTAFFPFKYLTADVVYHTDSVVLDVNGLCQNRANNWQRVLIHAVVPTPAPTDTIYEDLGKVIPTPNTIYECLYLEAENENYSIIFGLIGRMALQAGTYYTADLIKPEFVSLADNDTIEPAAAEMLVEEKEDGCFALRLNLCSAENILYVLDMHTAKTEITDTLEINCTSGRILPQTEFNMVQFYGEAQEYTAAVSVTMGALEQGLTDIPQDSIILGYTAVARRSDGLTVRAEQATARLENDEETGNTTLRAQLWGTDGTLYRLSIPLDYSLLPDAKDTINIDFGTGVGRVDYSQGLGMIGFVLADDGDVDVHVSAYCGMSLSGTIGADYFDYDGCYITTYSEETVLFSDIKAAQMTLDSIGDTLHITLDAVTLSDTLYHMTARLLPKYALTGNEVNYSVALADGVQMISLTADSTIYLMQFQRADQWTDEFEPLGDYELWTFRFLQTERNTIAGTYGYSAETLDLAQKMVLSEDGTEIYLAPFAGTLTINCKEQITLLVGGVEYKTHLYAIEANVLAETNMIYRLQGDNYLLLLNNETGEWIELSEGNLSAIDAALQQQGLRVRKVLRNGQLLIERTEGTYNMQGTRIE